MELPPIEQLVDEVTAATHLPGPQRLELLARTARGNGTSRPAGTSTCAGSPSPSWRRKARDCGVGTPRSSSNVSESPRRAHEPLGRSLEHLEPDNLDPDDPVRTLRSDIQETLLRMDTDCKATTTTAAGVPALNIVTECVTLKPLADFRTIVDPLEWPKCWLESTFFKAMDLVPPPPPLPSTLGQPDDGWQAVVLETVDFGFGFGGGPSGEVRTQLDFVYFFNPAPRSPAQGPAAGCTYDLNHSIDGKILVDQGYLLAEDLRHPIGGSYRRYATQKEVRFVSGTPSADDVCDFWSVATGLIKQWC